MVINVPLSLPPAPCLNGVYGYSPRCSRDLPKVEDPPPTQQRRGGGPRPGQGSREKLGLSQGEGSPQAASQHGLGAGTVFGELVPGPCQQSRASAAPSPGITACLRARARPA